jgi:hypothetical protein
MIKIIKKILHLGQKNLLLTPRILAQEKKK